MPVTTQVDIVEGWTAAVVFALLDNGQQPSGTLSGTVELILKDQEGNQLDFSGDVSITDASAWEVTVNPDAGDFVEGIYRGRFKVTDGSGKVAYFPSGQWLIFNVRTEA